jgi:hypothetical protein
MLASVRENFGNKQPFIIYKLNFKFCNFKGFVLFEIKRNRNKIIHCKFDGIHYNLTIYK